MPDLRYNLITGEWVVIAPERAARPTDRPAPEPSPPATHLADCPFCPGNEGRCEPETLRLPADGPWLLRSVPNRYPVLSHQGLPVRTGAGYSMAMNGVGRCEVIVETPRHDLPLARQPDEGLARVLRAYRDRMAALYQLPQVEHVIAFKNHGRAAGSSLVHPHSQIVGTPVVSGQIQQRITHALQFYADNGECVFCHCLRKELSDGRRLVEQNDGFVAFIPFAALSPFHLWIFPRRHGAYFGALDEDELSLLTRVLASVLRRLDNALGDPGYNLVVRSLSPTERELRYLHWYLSLVPRVSATAGFELGTGMYVNPSAPEDSARRLREASPESRPPSD